jgi:hypothetical protein
MLIYPMIESNYDKKHVYFIEQDTLWFALTQ